MKQLGLVGLIVLTTWIALIVGVRAESGVTPTPDQITVAGERGAVEARTLLLQATDPITGLRVISLDLQRADGATVLPAGAIRAALPADEIAAGSLLTIPLTIDLHDVPSGEFQGRLLVHYHAGALTVPLTVTVKDPWWLPLPVLFVGVGLGVVVSRYRAQGRPRDQVLMRVGQLRAQMRGDADLVEPFQARIEAHLVDVESGLQAENWEGARAAVERAEAVWTRWRKGREDWLAQFAYYAELVESLQKEPDAPYIQAVRRVLEDTRREAPEMEGPPKLRKRLDAVARQINRYRRLESQLDELNALRNRLPAEQTEQAEQWRVKTLGFQRRLHDLDPNDEAAYGTLQKEVEEAISELGQQIAQADRLESAVTFSKGGRDLGAVVRHLFAPPPAAREITEEATTGAARRLRCFTWASYGIVVALLAGAGFGELYVANGTFGANAWGDYFALLAWGFGAEATRAAVTEVVRGWGLPGLE